MEEFWTLRSFQFCIVQVEGIYPEGLIFFSGELFKKVVKIGKRFGKVDCGLWKAWDRLLSVDGVGR